MHQELTTLHVRIFMIGLLFRAPLSASQIPRLLCVRLHCVVKRFHGIAFLHFLDKSFLYCGGEDRYWIFTAAGFMRCGFG
jgi:hypothetical protein